MEKKIKKASESIAIKPRDENAGVEERRSPETVGIQVISARPIKKRKVDTEEEEEDDETVATTRLRPGLFSPQGILWNDVWSSRNAEGNLSVTLEPFDYFHGNNTIAINLTTFSDSNGWAFNLCPESDQYLVDILFHFNPRYKKARLAMTDRIGTWGKATSKKIFANDAIVSKELTLIVQFRPEGFLVLANDKFAGFFAHRRPLPLQPLERYKLVFITEDDNGNKLEVVIKKIWWGHQELEREILSPSVRASMEQAVEEQAEAASLVQPMPLRTILVSNLPKYSDLVDLQGLEYALFDLFDDFAPEAICMVRSAGLAYCKVPDAPPTSPTYLLQDIHSVLGVLAAFVREDGGGDPELAGDKDPDPRWTGASRPAPYGDDRGAGRGICAGTGPGARRRRAAGAGRDAG